MESVSDTYLETEYRVLESDTLARQAIGQLRLDLLPEFNPKAGRAASPSGGTPPPDPAAVDLALAQFHERLTVEPSRAVW